MATSLLAKANDIELRQLIQTYTTLSEHEKLKLLSKESSVFSYIPSFLFIQGINYPDFLRYVYINEMVLKGMVLQDQQIVLSNIRKSKDSTALNEYEQWRLYKAVIGKQLLLPIKEQVSYLDSLRK